MATSDELKALISHPEYQFIYDCGYLKPSNSHTIEDREDLIRCIWLYYVLFQPHAALEQLCAGFCETLQMERIVCIHSEELFGILIGSGAFDPTENDLIDDVVINYPEAGSNDRKKEENVILFWSDFITTCAAEGQLMYACM